MTANHRLGLSGAALWALLAIPAARHALESTMTAQMLIQLPLLALAGAWFAKGLPQSVDQRLAGWNHQGISGLLLASITAMVWMLPLMLDAALADPRVALAKFLSVPLLIGAPVALSWPRAGFVVRGVVLLEVTATAFRLGWLYLISPERLCANYLLDDQMRLGRLLAAIGVAIVAFLAFKLMWGRFDSGGTEPESHPAARG
ncbi:MAG: hypothetical protein IAE86_15560 [Burkholderiaceae bacterium]|nr:hypothetical protein [Burkholderiaceae bacterium]